MKRITAKPRVQRRCHTRQSSPAVVLLFPASLLHVNEFVIVVAKMVDDLVETALQTQPDPIDLPVIVVLVCLLNIGNDFADV